MNGLCSCPAWRCAAPLVFRIADTRGYDQPDPTDPTDQTDLFSGHAPPTGRWRAVRCTPLPDKLGFERGDLLVQQVVGLVDQADQRIRSDRPIIVFQPAGVQRPAFLIRQISQI